ncbi:hypothetical protein RH858_15990 [Halalkaliarchaeum sp. AArc-GB]|uniref:hypothetical protein n=1 Tax=Halalkaliarchaeum sp. AArc-GB TaxID=3074078 RepID=UPI002856DBF1|nr:hypothetical protein [Halalkaliarchaeum sp. AArc-GB]MDR5674626.1 hypothetical protein [Halalkaliarchaeum sp. AArc-GB]
MSENNDSEKLSKADEYRHPDGTVEVIFAIEGDRVLTVREYPERDRFREAVSAATSVGTNDAVDSLPGVEAFQDSEEKQPRQSGTDGDDTGQSNESS